MEEEEPDWRLAHFDPTENDQRNQVEEKSQSLGIPMQTFTDRALAQLDSSIGAGSNATALSIFGVAGPSVPRTPPRPGLDTLSEGDIKLKIDRLEGELRTATPASPETASLKKQVKSHRVALKKLQPKKRSKGRFAGGHATPAATPLSTARVNEAEADAILEDFGGGNSYNSNGLTVTERRGAPPVEKMEEEVKLEEQAEQLVVGYKSMLRDGILGMFDSNGRLR